MVMFMIDLVKKKCMKCGIEKNINEFYRNKSTKDGLCSYCKNCTKKHNKKYHCENRDALNKQKREHYQRNKIEALIKAKDYYRKNKEKVREKNRKYNLENRREYYYQNKERIRGRERLYRKENPEKIHKKDGKYSKKRRQNPQYRVSMNISRGISRSLIKGKNKQHWEDIVEYTIFDLKEHLESRFSEGMSWDNYGFYGWTIDHIIPISLWEFTSYQDHEFKQCWALANLQPMWSSKNYSKGNRLKPQLKQQRREG